MIQGEEYLGFVCRVRAAAMGGIRPVLKPRSQGASTMAVAEFDELMFGMAAEAVQKEDGIMTATCDKCGSLDGLRELVIGGMPSGSFLCQGCIEEIGGWMTGTATTFFKEIEGNRGFLYIVQGPKYLEFVLARRTVVTGTAETKNTPDEVLNKLQKKEEQDALDRVDKESPVVS